VLIKSREPGISAGLRCKVEVGWLSIAGGRESRQHLARQQHKAPCGPAYNPTNGSVRLSQHLSSNSSRLCQRCSLILSPRWHFPGESAHSPTVHSPPPPHTHPLIPFHSIPVFRLELHMTLWHSAFMSSTPDGSLACVQVKLQGGYAAHLLLVCSCLTVRLLPPMSCSPCSSAHAWLYAASPAPSSSLSPPTSSPSGVASASCPPAVNPQEYMRAWN